MGFLSFQIIDHNYYSLFAMVIYENNWRYGNHMLAMGPVSKCDKTYLRKIWYFIMRPYIVVSQRRNVNSFQLPTELPTDA